MNQLKNIPNLKVGVLTGFVFLILSYQNCSKRFSSQCDNCQSWKSEVAQSEAEKSAAQIAYYDEKQFEILLDSPDLILNFLAQKQEKNISSFFSEEFSAIVRIPKEFQGLVFNIHSENESAESANVSTKDGMITVQHKTSESVSYSLTYPRPSDSEHFILGVYFGYKVLDIRLVVNGRLISNDDPLLIKDLVGAPINYSYIEKKTVFDTKSLDLVLFKRKLSTYELASMSRHLAWLRQAKYVVYDNTILLDSDIDFVKERPDFIAARNVLKDNSCFKCHGSWVSYGEYNYLSSNLVKENSPLNSALWNRLKGTIEPTKLGKKKDMPLQLATLKDEELDILKLWIMSIRPLE